MARSGWLAASMFMGGSRRDGTSTKSIAFGTTHGFDCCRGGKCGILNFDRKGAVGAAGLTNGSPDELKPSTIPRLAPTVKYDVMHARVQIWQSQKWHVVIFWHHGPRTQNLDTWLEVACSSIYYGKSFQKVSILSARLVRECRGGSGRPGARIFDIFLK